MKRTELNDNWQFVKLSDMVNRKQEEWPLAYAIVNLPHAWYQDTDQYRGLAVYKKTVEVEAVQDRCMFLEIEAADHTVLAFANGTAIGLHKGGYSRIRFAIPKEVTGGGKLDLELYVDNRETEDVSPLSGDFTIFGGLYRGVSLLTAKNTHFDYCYYGTNGVIVRTEVTAQGSGILKLEPHTICDREQDAVKVKYTVFNENGRIVAEGSGAHDKERVLEIPEVCLWNGKERPILYTVRAELLVDGVCMDQTEVTTGFRRISINSESGFYLNDVNTKIRGVAKHQDTAGCFSAVTKAEIDHDFELIDDIGANAVRLSHYQHSDHTYDQCDKGGYITWAEIPMLKMTENENLQENAKQQLTELILQNIHHPSICFWGVQNEIAMFRDAPFVHKNVRELYDLAKELDPQRIVACANLYPLKAKSNLNHITDMVGYNIYFGWYYGKMEDYGPYLDNLHKELPDIPLGVSEYGVDADICLHSDTPLVKDYSEEFQALFHETVYPLIEERDYLWGSFVWNMFDFSSSRRDEGGQKYINAKGLVTYDRKVKKDAYYYYKARWSGQPFLHICSSRFVKRCSEQIDIKVYTNLPEAVLMAGDGSSGTILASDSQRNGMVVFHNVPLAKGENRFMVAGNTKTGIRLTKTVVFERTEVPETVYRLPGNDAGSTVQNWFLQEEDLDTEQYYSIKDRAEDLLENQETYQVLKKFIPDITALLEKGVIPMGLALVSIIGRDMEKDSTLDIKAMNLELMKVAK